MKQNYKPLIITLSVLTIICFLLVLIIGVVYQLSKKEKFADGDRDYDNAVITLKRTACYGTCPDYSITIHGNGRVDYEGNYYVNVEGSATYNIPKENVKQIVDKFYEIDYFSLKDSYTENVTDLPSTTTSISINGRYKEIYNYYGAPKKLDELEDYIDEMANTDLYVGDINE